MEKIRCVYRLACAPGEVEAVARAITYEQTVELPEVLVTSPSITERVVGRVVSIEPFDGAFRAEIEYNLDLASSQIPQLMNLLFGNVSIQPGIRLIDVAIPEVFLDRFQGPSYGVEGIRRLLGVRGRPLVATALKPRGAPVEELAGIAREFALAGGDIVKDDNNLVDESNEAFRERVLRCKQAVDESNERTGRNTLYLPNLSASVERLEEQVAFLQRKRIRGVLISPLVAGLDTTRDLLSRYAMVAMAHPSLTGSYYHCDDHGIAPGVLLGTIFRLLGADISVFPNFTGRFSFTREQCTQIRSALEKPLGRMAASFPSPAGGIGEHHLDDLADAYGEDAVYLIGAALLGHPEGTGRGTSDLLKRIRQRFPERLEEPEPDLSPVPEPRASIERPEPGKRLEFQEDYSWKGRPVTAYKGGAGLPFRGVTRHELIGRGAERTRFELRYFEIEPGGFSSLEKHHHTHTIICVRGRGVLIRGDERTPLEHLDVAYVAPMEPHQLRNETDRPFGFFCIVDRFRDRPMKP